MAAGGWGCYGGGGGRAMFYPNAQSTDSMAKQAVDIAPYHNFICMSPSLLPRPPLLSLASPPPPRLFSSEGSIFYPNAKSSFCKAKQAVRITPYYNFLFTSPLSSSLSLPLLFLSLGFLSRCGGQCSSSMLSLR